MWLRNVKVAAASGSEELELRLINKKYTFIFYIQINAIDATKYASECSCVLKFLKLNMSGHI